MKYFVHFFPFHFQKRAKCIKATNPVQSTTSHYWFATMCTHIQINKKIEAKFCGECMPSSMIHRHILLPHFLSSSFIQNSRKCILHGCVFIRYFCCVCALWSNAAECMCKECVVNCCYRCCYFWYCFYCLLAAAAGE